MAVLLFVRETAVTVAKLFALWEMELSVPIAESSLASIRAHSRGADQTLVGQQVTNRDRPTQALSYKWGDAVSFPFGIALAAYASAFASRQDPC